MSFFKRTFFSLALKMFVFYLIASDCGMYTAADLSALGC
jgi:hypothetical protein